MCACLVLSVSSSSWCLGRTAACDCDIPLTFFWPFLWVCWFFSVKGHSLYCRSYLASDKTFICIKKTLVLNVHGKCMLGAVQMQAQSNESNVSRQPAVSEELQLRNYFGTFSRKQLDGITRFTRTTVPPLHCIPPPPPPPYQSKPTLYKTFLFFL